MKIAKGNTRKIVKLVGEIQMLVGSAKGQVLNDRNPYAIDDCVKNLEKAFELCLEVTGMYEPIRERANKACARLETGAANADSESNPAVSSG